MGDERWERRDRKRNAERERMAQHGVAYKKVILPLLAERARQAQRDAADAPDPAAPPSTPHRVRGNPPRRDRR